MIIFELGNTYIKALWGKSISQISGIAVKAAEYDLVDGIAKPVSYPVDPELIKKQRRLILCIPRNQVTLRTLSFPSKDDEELDSMIDLHITQQVPYSKKDIIYNYTVLEKLPSGFTKVLLGIIHRDLLRKHFAFFEQLNMCPDSVQLSSFGLLSYLEKAKILKSHDQELKACLDIDTDSTEFLIFKGHKTIFSENIATGYLQINDPDSIDRFAGEIKQDMVLFKTEETREPIGRLYLSGMLLSEEIQELISTKLQLPVEVINPYHTVGALRNLNNADSLLRKVSLAAILGTAVNPGLSPFTFPILPEAELKRNIRDTAKNLIVTGSLIVYFIVLSLLAIGAKVYGKQIYLSALTQQVSTLRGDSKELIQIRERLSTVRAFCPPNDSFLYYYYKLAGLIPKPITIERIIFQRQVEFVLIGQATAMGEIYKFVSVLENAQIFDKVELRYSRKKTEKENEFNEFEIVCSLKTKESGSGESKKDSDE